MTSPPVGSYETLRIDRRDGIAWLTIDNPPLNLFDAPLRRDLDDFSHSIATEEASRVVVFRSANPDYFIAHSDVTLFVDRSGPAAPKGLGLNWIHSLGERLRALPQITIAQLEGRARGGGSELALNLDMRFAARGRAIFCQPEVALGIIPGGGGTQRLPRLMGRARALEAILGCEDFDADLAERYGWINRALPADELAGFVERLAGRIASFPPHAVALAKVAVHSAEPTPLAGLLEDADLFNQSVVHPTAAATLRAFLAAGGQTREYEMDLAERLSQAPAHDEEGYE